MVFDIKTWQFRHFLAVPHYVNLQNTTFPLKPIHCFDKIKLIFDPPDLNKKTKLILPHMPDESTVCCTLVLNGSGTYFSKEKHWPPRTWSFKFLSFGDKQGSTNRKKSSESFSATSVVSKDTNDKVNPCILYPNSWFF